MTDIQYKIQADIKKFNSARNKCFYVLIWIAGIILAGSYMIFFLSLSNPKWFPNAFWWRVVSGFSLFGAALGFFFIAKYYGKDSRKYKSTYDMLNKTDSVFSKYYSNNRYDLTNFVKNLKKAEKDDGLGIWKKSTQFLTTLNLLVVLPFITFISNSIIKVIGTGKKISSVSLEDAIEVFGMILFAASIVAIVEYLLTIALQEYKKTEHDFCIHLVENLIFIHEKNISIKEFSGLMNDFSDDDADEEDYSFKLVAQDGRSKIEGTATIKINK